jgi:hypothetical protein
MNLTCFGAKKLHNQYEDLGFICCVIVDEHIKSKTSIFPPIDKLNFINIHENNKITLKFLDFFAENLIIVCSQSLFMLREYVRLTFYL